MFTCMNVLLAKAGVTLGVADVAPPLDHCQLHAAQTMSLPAQAAPSDHAKVASHLVYQPLFDCSAACVFARLL